MQHVKVLQAQEIIQQLPPLAVTALRMVQNFNIGVHNRNQKGQGTEFYEYTPYKTGTPAKNIDWRASSRSEALYTRTNEKENAQKNIFWLEKSPFMNWHSHRKLPLKSTHATLITLAIAAGLLKAQEVIGLYPNTSQINAQTNSKLSSQENTQKLFYHKLTELGPFAQTLQKGVASLPPQTMHMGQHHTQHVYTFLIGAFTLNPNHLYLWLAHNPHITPVVIDIIDPAEATFPYKGMTTFRKFLATPPFIGNAQKLKQAYLEQWQHNQTTLKKTLQKAQGIYVPHLTNTPLEQTLHHLFATLGWLR